MVGASHSHDVRYPDDTWNLYAMLDTETTTALNVTRPRDVMGIFKPFVKRLETEPLLISDADDEMILTLRFTSPVTIRKLMIIGGTNPDQQPATLRCYPKQENIDFNNVETFRPAQTFNLQPNPEGTVELITTLHQYTNVSTLVLYFQGNLGGLENSSLRYIGMQGDHTHYKREAVHTVYEVLCNGQDICQPEDALGAAGHMH
jgi:hypothetical protein